MDIDDLKRQKQLLIKQKEEIDTRIEHINEMISNSSQFLLKKYNKKSSDRIFFEGKILAYLADETFKYKTRQLFELVGNFYPSLKYSTFRSYLSRMDKKGLIKKRDNKTWCIKNE